MFLVIAVAVSGLLDLTVEINWVWKRHGARCHPTGARPYHNCQFPFSPLPTSTDIPFTRAVPCNRMSLRKTNRPLFQRTRTLPNRSLGVRLTTQDLQCSPTLVPGQEPGRQRAAPSREHAALPMACELSGVRPCAGSIASRKGRSGRSVSGSA